MSDPFAVTTPAANASDSQPPTTPPGFWGDGIDGATVYPYPQQFNMYLTLGVVNTIEVYAVDEAGNRSAPATMTIDLR
ncbi:MAG: hypothetical protein ACRD3G_25125 [Vicinamibacterales bacterium]